MPINTNDKPLPANLLDWPVEMLQIVPREEAEELSGESWDSLKRNHPDKIIRMSPRRIGMRRGHALMLAS
jgi:hypothetical protein